MLTNMVGGLLFVLTIVCLFVVPSQSVGVTVSSKAKTTYEELKSNHKYRYIIYHITQNDEIDVESTGDRDLTYKDFLEELNSVKDQCRYVVFDYPLQDNSKLILLNWSPDDADVIQKMFYLSYYQALKQALAGVHKYLQATQLDEVSTSSIEEALTRN